MDQVLDTRWREGLAPFDGLIAVSPVLSEGELRSQLRLVIGVLPQIGGLVTFNDWHEHDGYIAPSIGESHDTIADGGVSARWSSDDTHVRRAWYSDDFGFVLRWLSTGDPDDLGAPLGDPVGRFDISGTEELVATIVSLVPGCEVGSAKSYFDRMRAG
jgi:hypothetical protein